MKEKIKKILDKLIIGGIFLIPFALFDPSLSELFLGTALLLFIILIILFPEEKKQLQLAIWDYPLIFFIGSVFISFFITPQKDLETVLFTAADIYLVLVYFLIKFRLSQNENLFLEIKKIFSISGMISCLIVIIGYLLLMFGWRFNLILFLNRAKGFFKDPNVLSAFLVVPLLLIVSKLSKKEREEKETFNDIVSIIILSTIFILTFSRGGIVNLSSSILILFVLNLFFKVFSNQKLVKLIIIPLFFSLFVLSTGWYLNEANLVFKTKEGLNKILYRYPIQQSIVSLWQRKPEENERLPIIKATSSLLKISSPIKLLIGYGTKEAESLIKTINPSIRNPSPHSSYLRIFLENGLFGLITFFIFLFLLLKNLIVKLKTKKEMADKMIFFALITGILLQGLFIEILHWRHFWVLLAIANFLGKEKEIETSVKDDKRKKIEKNFHDLKKEREEKRELCKRLTQKLYDDDPYNFFINRISLKSKNKIVLNYGCGEDDLIEILEKGGAKQIFGIDISTGMIERARQKYPPEKYLNVTLLTMDAENLSFDNDFFDLVVGQAILHHLDLKRAFSEISRVLKKDGQAIFIEPRGENFFINLFRKLTPQSRTPYEHPLKQKDIDLAKNFFKEVKTNEFIFLQLLIIPFNLTFLSQTKIFKIIRNLLRKLDHSLSKINFLKKYYWITVIELKK
jgi:ubiquinone/menaquinone biosynthesis C-methylase UbiE/O-antigen ligase